MRTAQEIIDQTNALAREFYALRGYQVKEGHRFDIERANTHPDEQMVWQMACVAQIMLTDTDPEDALLEIESDE